MKKLINTKKLITRKSYSRAHYLNAYFKNHSFYLSKYTKEMINDKLDLYKPYDYLIKKFLKRPVKMLEVGVGEGFGAKFFYKKYDYTGTDLTDEAFKYHNAKILKHINFIKGDFLKLKTNKNKKYNVLLFNGVVEHLSELSSLLKFVENKLKKNGLLLINVPNDFNPFQIHYLKSHNIQFEKANFISQEHANYFNPKSLKNLFKSYKCLTMFTNYPIDAFLLNDKTNYYINKKFGSEAASVSIEVERILKKDMENYIKLGEAQARLGIGRAITACFKK